jgi:uncharacterized HAD superfamily protein
MIDDYFKKENQKNSPIKTDIRITQYEKIEREIQKDKAIIVDLDGTLSLIYNRNVYEDSKSLNDQVNKPVLNILNKYKDDHKIIIITGRSLKDKDVTLDWLHINNIPYDYLYMRDEKDFKPDYIVKLDIYKRFIQNKFNIQFVLEDRNQVVEMYRDLGLPCFQVYYGDF